MNRERIINAILSDRWAITSAGLEFIIGVVEGVESNGAIEALNTKKGHRLEGADSALRVIDGVAIIPITGPIMRRSTGLDAWCGARSLQTIAADFDVAINNPNVQAIVLEIDSPGGQVTGINEFSQMIFDARGKKPICAYVEGTGASAAYWIASAADEIIADKTAILGSIGVVAGFRDEKKKEEREGVSTIEIVSSKSPNKRVDVTTDAGRAKVQATIDSIADIFIDTVARNRGISAEKVVSDFGEGGVLVGQQAVAAGMADRLGSLEDACKSVRDKAATANQPNSGGKRMSEKTQTVEASDLQTRIEALEKQNAELKAAQETSNAQAEKLAQDNAKLKADSQRKEFSDLVAGKNGTAPFLGDHAQHVTMLEGLAEKFGAESAEFKFYVSQNQAAATQVKDGKLFAELGTDAPGNTEAEAEVDTKTKALMKAEPTLTYQQAYSQVLAQNPDLYDRL